MFPFVKFPGVDTILGPEMRSTGEVMGVGRTFGEAFVKSADRRRASSCRAVGQGVPHACANSDKPRAVEVARDAGRARASSWSPPRGTAAAITAAGIAVQRGEQGDRRPAAHRRHDQERRDRAGHQHRRGDAQRDRRLALHPPRGAAARVTYYTTIAGARGRCAGMKHMDDLDVTAAGTARTGCRQDRCQQRRRRS